MQKNDVFSQPRTFLQSHKSTVYLIVRVVMRIACFYIPSVIVVEIVRRVYILLSKRVQFLYLFAVLELLYHICVQKNAADNFNYDTIRDATLTCAQKLT